MPKRNKQKRTRRRRSQSREQVLQGVLVELRSILRQKTELKRPISHFAPAPPSKDGEPRFYVVFDNAKRRPIKGMLLKTETLRLPDEKIQDAVLNFAQSVWHLKDRLNLLTKNENKATIVQSVIDHNIELQVCADLANTKKHGVPGIVSGMSPTLDLVTFDTSQSGVLEFFYKGDAKQKELIVSNRVPIPYWVDILANEGKQNLGNSVDYIWRAFTQYLPLISDLEILFENTESSFLKSQLFTQQVL